MKSSKTKDVVLLGESAPTTTPHNQPKKEEIDDFVRHMEARGYGVACRMHVDHDANLGLGVFEGIEASSACPASLPFPPFLTTFEALTLFRRGRIIANRRVWNK